MPLVDLNNENFDAEIERYAVTIIDFWAPWCAPCKAFAPVYEAAAAQYPDILFARVNTEDEPTIAKQFEVQSIPTLLTAKEGTIVHCQVGAVRPDKLEKMIQELRKS